MRPLFVIFTFVTLHSCKCGNVLTSTADLKEVQIRTGSTPIPLWESFSPDTLHIVVYAHSPFYEISLSFSRFADARNSANGTHVGVLALRSGPSQLPSQVYVYSKHYETFSIWLGINKYTFYDPIPGGCNQVFGMENDPNMQVRSLEPMMQQLKFALSSSWTRNRFGQLETASCDDSSQWSALTYHLYAIPLANLGGQRWPPWSNVNENSGGISSQAMDVGQWPFSRTLVANQMQLLASGESAMKFGQHIASYKPSYIIVPPQFTIARRYANAHAFVVVVRRDDGQGSPVAHIPTMLYLCPSAGSGLLHRNSSWNCNLLIGESSWHSYLTGALMIAAAFVFLSLSKSCPRFTSAVCFYLVECLIISVLVLRYSDTATKILLLSLCFGVAPILALIEICLQPKEMTLKVANRVAFWPSCLLVFLLLAGIFFSPLNTWAVMRQPAVFIPVVVGINLVAAFLVLCVSTFAYSLSVGCLTAYAVLVGVSLICLPQSLWYIMPADQFLRYASHQHFQAVHYNPVGIYDMAAGGICLAVGLFFTLILTSLWRDFFKQSRARERTRPNAVHPTNAARTNRPTRINQQQSGTSGDQYTVIFTTNQVHLNEGRPASERGTANSTLPEASAPRPSGVLSDTELHNRAGTPFAREYERLRIADGDGGYGATRDFSEPPPSYQNVYPVAPLPPQAPNPNNPPPFAPPPPYIA